MVETSNEWIITRTGIAERRIAEHDSTATLGAKAAAQAIESAGLAPNDIDAIVLSTSAPDMLFPSSACLVQNMLGITNNCPSFDISAACTGFSYALSIAESFVKSGAYKNVLVIGSDVLSKMVDWQDRTTCILFGDGAGAVVVGRCEEGYGIIKSVLHSDGSGTDILKIPAGGTAIPASRESVENRQHYIKMNGNEVFKFATRIIPRTCEELLDKTQYIMEDISYLIPHQANDRILKAAALRMNIPRNKIMKNLDKYGNTSTASIPLALHELSASNKLKKSDIVLLVGFGAGLTWGGNLIRWNIS